MKNLCIAFGAAALMTLASCDSGNKPASTNEAKVDTMMAASETHEAPAPPMDSAEMMKAWQAYMTPGDMHKMMASCDGVWNEEITMWMAPDGPPTTSTATATNKMILNGLYQESKTKGSFNGMPFEGVSMMAYDNTKKKFISTWIDNMGSGVMYMEGTYDDASKTMTSTGKSTDPMSGKDCEIRSVTKFIDNDHQTLEMYATPAGGKEYKNMEIKLTRKSKA